MNEFEKLRVYLAVGKGEMLNPNRSFGSARERDQRLVRLDLALRSELAVNAGVDWLDERSDLNRGLAQTQSDQSFRDQVTTDRERLLAVTEAWVGARSATNAEGSDVLSGFDDVVGDWFGRGVCRAAAAAASAFVRTAEAGIGAGTENPAGVRGVIARGTAAAAVSAGELASVAADTIADFPESKLADDHFYQYLRLFWDHYVVESARTHGETDCRRIGIDPDEWYATRPVGSPAPSGWCASLVAILLRSMGSGLPPTDPRGAAVLSRLTMDRLPLLVFLALDTRSPDNPGNSVDASHYVSGMRLQDLMGLDAFVTGNIDDNPNKPLRLRDDANLRKMDDKGMVDRGFPPTERVGSKVQHLMSKVISHGGGCCGDANTTEVENNLTEVWGSFTATPTYLCTREHAYARMWGHRLKYLGLRFLQYLVVERSTMPGRGSSGAGTGQTNAADLLASLANTGDPDMEYTRQIWLPTRRVYAGSPGVVEESKQVNDGPVVVTWREPFPNSKFVAETFEQHGQRSDEPVSYERLDNKHYIALRRIDSIDPSGKPVLSRLSAPPDTLYLHGSDQDELMHDFLWDGGDLVDYDDLAAFPSNSTPQNIELDYMRNPGWYAPQRDGVADHPHSVWTHIWRGREQHSARRFLHRRLVGDTVEPLGFKHVRAIPFPRLFNRYMIVYDYQQTTPRYTMVPRTTQFKTIYECMDAISGTWPRSEEELARDNSKIAPPGTQGRPGEWVAQRQEINPVMDPLTGEFAAPVEGTLGGDLLLRFLQDFWKLYLQWSAWDVYFRRLDSHRGVQVFIVGCEIDARASPTELGVPDLASPMDAEMLERVSKTTHSLYPYDRLFRGPAVPKQTTDAAEKTIYTRKGVHALNQRSLTHVLEGSARHNELVEDVLDEVTGMVKIKSVRLETKDVQYIEAFVDDICQRYLVYPQGLRVVQDHTQIIESVTYDEQYRLMRRNQQTRRYDMRKPADTSGTSQPYAPRPYPDTQTSFERRGLAFVYPRRKMDISLMTLKRSLKTSIESYALQRNIRVLAREFNNPRRFGGAHRGTVNDPMSMALGTILGLYNDLQDSGISHEFWGLRGFKPDQRPVPKITASESYKHRLNTLLGRATLLWRWGGRVHVFSAPTVSEVEERFRDCPDGSARTIFNPDGTVLKREPVDPDQSVEIDRYFLERISAHGFDPGVVYDINNAAVAGMKNRIRRLIRGVLLLAGVLLLVSLGADARGRDLVTSCAATSRHNEHKVM